MRPHMANEALFSTAGPLGLFVAMLTGALWDSPVATAPVRYFQSTGLARSYAADLAAVLFYPVVNEVEALLGSQSLDYEDLTACEVVTMAGVLRAALGAEASTAERAGCPRDGAEPNPASPVSYLVFGPP